MENGRPGRWQVLLLGVVFEGGLGALAWLLGWWLEQPPLERFAWEVRDLAWGVAACLPMAAAFFLVRHGEAEPLRRVREVVDEIIPALLGRCTWVELAVLSLLAGVGEEMLFRGVLQPVFGRWLHPWAGLLLASLLFGLVHPLTWLYVVLAALFGVYLGWLYVATDNLLTPITAHAVYDFVVLLYLLRGHSESGSEGRAHPGPK
jgi:CAAX protease family protein